MLVWHHFGLGRERVCQLDRVPICSDVRIGQDREKHVLASGSLQAKLIEQLATQCYGDVCYRLSIGLPANG